MDWGDSPLSSGAKMKPKVSVVAENMHLKFKIMKKF